MISGNARAREEECILPTTLPAQNHPFKGSETRRNVFEAFVTVSLVLVEKQSNAEW
jgi:hypothetical protein